MHLPITGIVSAGAAAITYLLRATFTAANQSFADAQVLDTEAEGVEDGSLTCTILDGGMDIVSNQLSITAQTTAGADQLLIQSADAITRELGTTVLIKQTSRTCYVGFGSPLGSIWADPDTLYLAGSLIKQGSFNAPATTATFYDVAIILGGFNSSGQPYKSGEIKADYSYGRSFFVRGGAEYPNWTLLHRRSALATSLLYPGCSYWSSSAPVMDHIKVPDVDLSGLLEPNNLNTTVATTNTFTHIADCMIELLLTTLPSSGNLDIDFRRQDDSNKWICRVTSAGAISLVEVVATVETTRIGPVASAVANGDRIAIAAEDETISVYSKEANRGTYASATNFKTDTGGKIVFGSGAVGHLADWARNTGYSDLDNY